MRSPSSKIVSICILLVTCVIAGNISAEDELFKISKLNLVWTKAQHSLGPSKLKDLKKDLAKHEFDELTLKKMKAHNQDKDGLFEAAARKKLLSIMTKYSLERYYDGLHPPIESEHDMKKDTFKKIKAQDRNSMTELKPTFRDKKLDKLWKKAEQSAFTQEQLMILHEEFQHQQDKLDEHYETRNLIDQQLDSMNKKGERGENSIEMTLESETIRKVSKKSESPTDKKARLDANMHQVLKEKYSDIKKDIDKLHKKIIGRKIDDDGPFEEAPVNDLWLAAARANFTSSELESLREELEHYQIRIKKLRHFEAQLERNRIGAKDYISNSEDDDDAKHIRKRVKELGYKIEKTHKTIEKKILNKRVEL